MFHSLDYLHRDIKPENFLIGLESAHKNNQVYIIDYGLAKRYRDAVTHAHVGYTEGKSLTGTARYASLSAHMGVEQSRRDDLESIGYVLMFFLRGKLPWQGLKHKTVNGKNMRIHACKLETPLEILCEGFPRI